MKNLNKYIDHTLLKADATREQIVKLCQEAREYDFASVCVNSCWVATCKKELEGTDVKVCTVIGFPLGAMNPVAKAYEVKEALADGADEFDTVINVGALKGGNIDYVTDDIAAVVKAANGKTVKVIIETCLLTEDEKLRMCRIVTESGADYIKTSTGFSTAGATREDVALMRANVGAHVKVKAAGGIASLQDAEDFINLGADRLGTSRVVKIIKNTDNGGY